MKVVRFYEEDEVGDFLEIRPLKSEGIFIELYNDKNLIRCLTLSKQTTIDLIKELELQVAKLD
jgi:hypothetical protein